MHHYHLPKHYSSIETERMMIPFETCGYRMSLQHFSALQIIYVNTRGYIHKYHSTLLSIELLLQLQTTVTSVLRLYRSYFDNYLSELAFSSYFTIYSKMVTTTRTLHLFEHIELLSHVKIIHQIVMIKNFLDQITIYLG